MGFCLDCHRNVESHLRPLDQITNLDWDAHDLGDLEPEDFYAMVAQATGKPAKELQAADEEEGAELSAELFGKHLQEAWGIHPPQDCAACHR